jgi:anti-sigma regulatory factor (Ser/Thr protein kinase)
MEHVTQEFLSDLRQLSALRAVVRDACRRAWARPDEEGLAQLELAVGEAAANIMLHAYGGRNDQPVEVMIAAGPNEVRVSLFHQGDAFDPKGVPPPSFDGSRESGFGMYLIRQTVDECTFFQDERGHHGVRLTKRWNGGM